MTQPNMKNNTDSTVCWGRFGPKSTRETQQRGSNSAESTSSLGGFKMVRRLFGLRRIIDSEDMDNARKDAAELVKRGCPNNAPVLKAILAEMMAEIEVKCGRYYAAETLLRDVAIPGYREMPNCVSMRARRSLQALYSVRRQQA